LKTSYGGTLYVACLKDSQNKIRIIAVGISGTESYSNWFWFLTNLKQFSPIIPNYFIFDREKGLMAAFEIVYPSLLCSATLK
jgi:hypothetical protein